MAQPGGRRQCRLERLGRLPRAFVEAKLKGLRIPLQDFHHDEAASTATFSIPAGDLASRIKVRGLKRLGHWLSVVPSVEGDEGWQDDWDPGRCLARLERRQGRVLVKALALTQDPAPKRQCLRTPAVELAGPAFWDPSGDWAASASLRTDSRAAPRLAHLRTQLTVAVAEGRIQPQVQQIIETISRQYGAVIADERDATRVAKAKSLDQALESHVRILLESSFAGASLDVGLALLALRKFTHFCPELLAELDGQLRRCRAWRLLDGPTRFCQVEKGNCVTQALPLIICWKTLCDVLKEIAIGPLPLDPAEAPAFKFVTDVMACLVDYVVAAEDGFLLSTKKAADWRLQFPADIGVSGFLVMLLRRVRTLRPDFDDNKITTRLTGSRVCPNAVCARRSPRCPERGQDIIRLPFQRTLREAALDRQQQPVPSPNSCPQCGGPLPELRLRVQKCGPTVLLAPALPPDLAMLPISVGDSLLPLMNGFPFIRKAKAVVPWVTQSVVLVSGLDQRGEGSHCAVLCRSVGGPGWVFFSDGAPTLFLSDHDARRFLDDPSTAAVVPSHAGTEEYFGTRPTQDNPERRGEEARRLHPILIVLREDDNAPPFPSLTVGPFDTSFPGHADLGVAPSGQGFLRKWTNEDGYVLAVKVGLDFFSAAMWTEMWALHKAGGPGSGLVPVMGVHIDPDEIRPSVSIVMPYYGRKDSFKYLLEQAPDLKARLKIAIGVCTGIQTMHTVGVYHGDIKLPNFFVDDDGNGILGDAGTAVELREGDWALSSAFGTQGFIPPELRVAAPGVALFGRPGDVWAGAVGAYQLITIGGHPFDNQDVGPDRQAAWAANSTADRPFFGLDPLPTLAQGPVDVLRACVAKDPSARPSATDLVVALQELHGAQL